MIPKFSRFTLLSIAISMTAAPLLGQAGGSTSDLKYQTPPAIITKMVDAPPTPTLSLSPANASGPQMVLIKQSSSLSTIADLAEPELRLAGLRFNPKANAPSRTRYSVWLKLQAMPTPGAAATSETNIAGLPEKLHAVFTEWSPDGKHIAVVNQDTGAAAGLSLWLVDVAKAHATRVPSLRLNAVLTEPIAWIDSTSLAVLAVPTQRRPAPVRSEIPAGPVVQENEGRATPAPTFEDMLKNPTDELLFEYHATAQIVVVKLGTGAIKPLGKPGLFSEIYGSPDGRYLLAKEIHRPFSYHQPYDRFPERREVYAIATGAAKVLDDAPLIDNLPIDNDAVEPGPREYGWRADQPATVYWVQAGDGGDPKRDAPVRDRIYTLDAPFTGSPKTIAELTLRYASIYWGNEHLAIVMDRRWKDRKIILSAVDPATAALTQLYQGSSQDRYHDPGRPMMQRDTRGQILLQTTADKQDVYFSGPGASPTGEMPFVAIMPVGSGENPKENRIWQSQPPYFEAPIAMVSSGDAVEILARRESVEQSPTISSPLRSPLAPVAPTTFLQSSNGRRSRNSLTHMPACQSQPTSSCITSAPTAWTSAPTSTCPRAMTNRKVRCRHCWRPIRPSSRVVQPRVR